MNEPGGIFLTSREMAQFVSAGFLRFDAVVPANLNEAAVRLFAAGLEPAPPGQPLAAIYPPGEVIAGLLDLPRIRGAISSLVGPEPIVDHHWLHARHPREPSVQRLHSDGMIDLRRTSFDVQIMYYPLAVPPEKGATLIIPGSHFRLINELDIARYQNLRGQVLVDCPAGSVLIAHHGLWHCGTRNTTNTPRYMFQLRLCATTAQYRTWDLSDIDDPTIDDILAHRFAWFEYADARLELVNRIRAWRALTGKSFYDIDTTLSRFTAATEPDRLMPGSP